MVHGPIYGRFMGFYVNGFLYIERIQILIFRMLRTQQCRCSPMLIFRAWTTCAYIEVVLRRFRSILPVYFLKKSWKCALFWFRSRSAFIKTCWASVPFESWGEDAKGLEYSTIKSEGVPMDYTFDGNDTSIHQAQENGEISFILTVISASAYFA